jgi:copper chaperone CopZ
MFKFHIIFISLLLPVILLASDTGSDSTAVSDSLNSQVMIYEMFGMDCPGCHSGIENLVNKIPGVTKSEANWEKQELKIWVDPAKEVKEEAIFDAIERANFTPGDRIK